MAGRLDKYKNYRKDISNANKRMDNSTFVQDNLTYFYQQLKPILSDQFIEEWQNFALSFNINNFKVNYNFFTSLYSRPLEYDIEAMLTTMRTTLNDNDHLLQVRNVHFRVKFYDAEELHSYVENLQFNYEQNQQLMTLLWNNYQRYESENLKIMNESLPVDSAENIDQQDFQEAHTKYNQDIKNFQGEFTSTNAKLLLKIRKFKIRGKIVFFILPGLLLLTAIFLGLALFFK